LNSLGLLEGLGTALPRLSRFGSVANVTELFSRAAVFNEYDLCEQINIKNAQIDMFMNCAESKVRFQTLRFA
jgi:hypothetical protein